jgi:hypothetical protein
MGPHIYTSHLFDLEIVRLRVRVGHFVMRTIPIAVALFASVACSSSSEGPPAQVAGDYTLTITDGQNGCNVLNFTTNATQSGTIVTIAQNGSALSATATHMSGLVLAFAAGDKIGGMIEAEEASLASSANLTQGGCAYTLTATTNMTFHENQMQGTTLYTASGNGSPDCGPLQNCTTTQTFTGAR